MTPKDKKSAPTDSADVQPSANQQEAIDKHDDEQAHQSTPGHTEPAEDMIPASYLLKLLKDDWIRATDAAWMRGEAAANRGALSAELISSRIGQFLDDGGHAISCSDIWHLITTPIQKGQAPQERMSTVALCVDQLPRLQLRSRGGKLIIEAHDPDDDLHDEPHFDPELPY